MNLLTIATHNGPFHADEVFAAAVIQLGAVAFAPIIRTRDLDIIKMTDIVLDVGGVYDPSRERYDHHQWRSEDPETPKRENGNGYATFGLVWKGYWGLGFVRQVLWDMVEDVEILEAVRDTVDASFVRHVDARDIGVKTESTLGAGAAAIISSFNVTASEFPESQQERGQALAFIEAVEMARKILTREVIRVYHNHITAAVLERVLDEQAGKNIIEVPTGVPWMRAMHTRPEIQYVISQKSDGSWGIQTPSAADDIFANRCPFPKAWRGKVDENLAGITGVGDAVFCHANGFFAVTKTREGAWALAQKSLEVQG